MENQTDGLSRLAAAANIVRGAVQGGAAGAAAQAAKTFAPQLLRLTAGILFFVLCLPLLFFVALPSSMFGFPSLEDSDIRDMTRQAQLAAQAYEHTQQRIEARAGELEVLAAAGYDDVRTTRDLTGLTSDWVAAISSVLCMQDLSGINGGGTDSVFAHSVVQTTREETYEEEETYLHVNEDGTQELRTRTVERTRIFIDQRAASPPEVMAALGFTDEQKQWAQLIADVLAGSQRQDGDTPSLDLGDVIFTDASTPVTYYNQTDMRWGEVGYSGSTIGVAGCGPSCVAIVASSLTGSAVTPVDAAAWSEQNGHAAYGNGSYPSLIPEALTHYGLTVERAGTPSAQQLVDALAAGKLVVVLMGPGAFTTSGHYIVLRGVTSDGGVLVADPYTYGFCQREWDIGLILRQAKHGCAAGGPFWIVS